MNTMSPCGRRPRAQQTVEGHDVDGLDNLPRIEELTARQTASDHVSRVLREAILTGTLSEGEELNQVALAEHFGVSRVPVREALRQLTAEGLVGQEAHHRAVVTTVSRERLSELFDLREILETYMLRRAIDQVTPELIAELRAVTDEMSDLDDHDEWLRLNRKFHALLYSASGATYTEELTGQIAARTTRYLWASSGGKGIDRVGEAHAEHIEILGAVVAGDVERATRTLVQHIEGTRRRVENMLDTAPSAEGDVSTPGAVAAQGAGSGGRRA